MIVNIFKSNVQNVKNMSIRIEDNTEKQLNHSEVIIKKWPLASNLTEGHNIQGIPTSSFIGSFLLCCNSCSIPSFSSASALVTVIKIALRPQKCTLQEIQSIFYMKTV